jgi:hypothetical protein
VTDASKKVGGTCGPTKSNHSSKVAADKEAAKNKHYLVVQAKDKLDLGMDFNPLVDGFKLKATPQTGAKPCQQSGNPDQLASGSHRRRKHRQRLRTRVLISTRMDSTFSDQPSSDTSRLISPYLQAQMFLRHTLPRSQDDRDYKSLAKDIKAGVYRFDPADNVIVTIDGFRVQICEDGRFAPIWES